MDVFKPNDILVIKINATVKNTGIVIALDDDPIIRNINMIRFFLAQIAL